MIEGWRERCAYLKLRSEILSDFLEDLDRLLMTYPMGVRTLPRRDVWVQALLTVRERLTAKIEEADLIISQYQDEATDRKAA